MASLVAQTKTPKTTPVKPEFVTPTKPDFVTPVKEEFVTPNITPVKSEFLTPKSIPAPRKDPSSSASSTPVSARSGGHVNFVEILTESRASRTLSEKFRLILSSLKYIYTGCKPPVLIPPVQLLTELSKMTSLLDGFNEMLVSEIFKVKVLSQEADVLAAYLGLLVELGRSNAFLHEELARHLLSSMAAIEEDQAPEAQLDLVHCALQRMLKELPHFDEALLRQISKCLPFMTKPWRQQVHMYRQMLRVVDYVSASLSLEVLSRLIHKVIDLDCHCPKEEMLAAEEADNDSTQFAMDNADGVESGQKNENSSASTESAKVEEAEKEMKHGLGNTFDRVMELFFGYIDKHMAGDLADAKLTYRRFLAVFDKYIMSTYKCLHIQFLMFYICSKRPLFTDHLIDFLWQKVQNPNTSVIFRQMSIAYLGSLLSRALFVSVGTLKDTLALLARFLHGYLAQTSSAQTPGFDVNRHATFYAVCQSLLYCIAFRHKDIVDSVNGLEYLRSLNLEQLITSPLNPLKVMSKSIAMNFANVSRHYQIVYCHSIIERNQRSALPMAQSGYDASGNHIGTDQGSSHYSSFVESYFPFDPYALIRSKHWIEPIYRHYVDHFEAAAADEEDENPEEETGDAMETGGEDGIVAMSVTSTSGSVPGQAEKLFAYSVSPGFVH